jgi:hypothetical protein
VILFYFLVFTFDSVVGLDAAAAAAAAFSGSCTAGVSVMCAGAYLFRMRNLSFLSSENTSWKQVTGSEEKT